MARITAIDLLFEREKKMMLEHYQKKAKKNKNNEEQLTNNSLTGHTMLHSSCPSIQTILPTLKKVQRRCCDDATNGSICTTLGCESNGAQNKNALRATEVQEKTKLRISECPTKN